MKKNLKLLITTLLLTLIVTTTGIAMAAESPLESTGVTTDAELTLEEMLTYAIKDEYMAQAEYDAIMAEYGSQRPFSNITRAEAMHIDLLVPLFETYGFNLPVNDAASKVALPSSITEGYVAGVDAETKNIAMYESYLKEDLPADVQTVFEHLKAASEQHLRVFENAVNGTFGAGMKAGNVQGNGSRGNGQFGNGGRGNGAGQGGMNRGLNDGSGIGNSLNCIYN